MVKIFKKNASDWFRILTTCILRNDGKSKVNACRPAVETEVGRALLAAVTPSLDAESISRYASRCFHTVDAEELARSYYIYNSEVAIP